MYNGSSKDSIAKACEKYFKTHANTEMDYTTFKLNCPTDGMSDGEIYTILRELDNEKCIRFSYSEFLDGHIIYRCVSQRPVR